MKVADWYAYVDRRAARPRGAYRDSAVNEPRALLDTDQTQPAIVTSAPEVESLTIVSNREGEAAILPRKRHRSVSGMSVSRGVSECLLSDAK
jgi:hypothetical protein